MMASRFRINRYNWFCQKLLAHHEYNDIVWLRNYLVTTTNHQSDGQVFSPQTSDWVTYIHGLALIRTSARLDEVIYSLQQLNYDKNIQQFLLLCQSLLYLGNHESVIALCRQVINREIDSKSRDNSIDDTTDMDAESADEAHARQQSFEFNKIIFNIHDNHMISEPKLWLILGLCLEYQRQFKDADLAYRVASKLLSSSQNHSGDNSNQNDLVSSTIVSPKNFQSPIIRYVEFRLKHAADYRTAIQNVNQSAFNQPQSFVIGSLLSLLVSAQPSANQSHFSKALQTISTLESHMRLHKNPALSYNLLALRCRQHDYVRYLDSLNIEVGDDDRTELNFLLTKCYIVVNNIIHCSSQSLAMYKSHLGDENNDNKLAIDKQLDRLIGSMRGSDPACWASASFWSNLGICFMTKRKFVACLSCLIKAQQIEPLDWRIHYNLGLACLHVGLVSRALVNLLSCHRSYKVHQKSVLHKTSRRLSPNFEPSITTLIAICYDKMDERNTARRHYVETIGPRNSTPVAALVSYLIFVHRICRDQPDDELIKIKTHLLDTLEQAWLQRNQNDSQYNRHLLMIASQVVNESSDFMKGRSIAWTKSDLTRCDP